MAMYLFLVLIFVLSCLLVSGVFIVCCLSLQAGERTVEENGQPEAQGAAGEEQERPADGGRQEERGQSERKFPADKGVWSGRVGWNWEVQQRKFLSISQTYLENCLLQQRFIIT